MDWLTDTEIIHNKNAEKKIGALANSIVPSAVYSFDKLESAHSVIKREVDGLHYGRYGSPTTLELEKQIAALEGGEAGLALASGMAAIVNSLLYYIKSGDHVIGSQVYGGTYGFLTTTALQFGMTSDFIDFSNLDNLKNAIKENTKAIIIETPTNPGLAVYDIEKIAAIAHEHNIPLIVDNTFMTPYLQKPLELGADLVVHSATKYLNGHGDVLAGIVVGDKEVIESMRRNILGKFGQTLSAFDAYLILRSLKTLGVRMERHVKNTEKVVEYLQNNPDISKVYFPGIHSEEEKAIAKKQMRGMGGMVSFEVEGDYEQAEKFINSMELATISVSLGDPETLIQHPASMTHAAIPKEEYEDFGITETMIRLSVGFEDPNDIIEDIAQALVKIKN